jgi:hypothetical protein
MSAFQLEKYEAAIQYLDACDVRWPDQPWTPYYRAASLLELDRPQEALAAAGEEVRRVAECGYPSLAHRTSALGALGQVDEFRMGLIEILSTPLTEAPYLSARAFAQLFRRLWLSARCLPEGDPLTARLDEFVLAAGVAPEELFQTVRQAGKCMEGVRFFRCLVRQPLDERWSAWPGRRVDEADWSSYLVTWGVLARTPKKAERAALSWQSRCFPLPAEVLELDEDEENDFTDSPGVVWQGLRFREADEREQPDLTDGDEGWDEEE